MTAPELRALLEACSFGANDTTEITLKSGDFEVTIRRQPTGKPTASIPDVSDFPGIRALQYPQPVE